MEYRDNSYGLNMQIEYKNKRQLTPTQENGIKRIKRAIAKGRIGKFINWFDFTKSKKKIHFMDFNQFPPPFSYGRIGNKIYSQKTTDGEWTVYRKFKNATKAKKFFKMI